MFSENRCIAQSAHISPLVQSQQQGEVREEIHSAAATVSSEIAIHVQSLSKCYHIYATPRDRLKQFIVPRLQRLLGQAPKQYFREFWALKDVSFEVRKGETVGIVGKNGSGKSTLLQLICGTLAPTSGSIKTRGRIAALLELGSGFNPEFTGRENVYMNAAVLGLSKAEVDERFDDIAAFADIGEFIERPVKTYSSGMYVRLAFAVQAQVNPGILIVDEALSVGDARFQAKCFARLQQLKENGTSILLVSHSSEQIVAHCSSAILLNHGIQVETGEPRAVVNRYLDLLFGKEKKSMNVTPIEPPVLPRQDAGEADACQLSDSLDKFSTRHGYNIHEYRWGDGTASILDFYLAADDEAYPSTIAVGQLVMLAVSIRFHSALTRPILGIAIKTKDGVTVSGTNSEMQDCEDFRAAFKEEAVIHAKANFRCALAPGDYFIALGIVTREGEEIVPHDRRYDSIHFVVPEHKLFHGLADLGINLRIAQVSV